MGRTPRASRRWLGQVTLFAFDVLYDANPDALGIVDVQPEND
jgi:hypothetical protein